MTSIVFPVNMATMRRSMEDRERLLEKYDQFPPMSQRAAARLLNISPSQLCVWLRNRKILRASVNLTKGSFKTSKTQLLEAALWRWIDNLRGKGITKNELMVRSKANMLAKTMDFRSFRASKDWFNRFKIRETAIRKRFLDDPSEEPRCVDPALPIATSSRADCTLIGEKRNAVEQPEDESDKSYEEILEPSENESEADHIHVIKQWDDVSAGEPSDATTELNIPKLEPTVITAEVNGVSHTVVVPSLWQMREAMKTLSTGLLYRGFCDFKLLHQFEKEVDSVVRRSVSLRTQCGFEA